MPKKKHTIATKTNWKPVKEYYLKNANGRFYFTNQQLGQMLFCSESSINNAIRALSTRGFIERQSKIRAGGGTMRFIRLLKNSQSECEKSNSQSVRKVTANDNKVKENKNIYIPPFPILTPDYVLYKQKLMAKGLSEETAETELAKFTAYWTEKSPFGKQRWESQKFFEVNRRLATWINNVLNKNKYV